MFKTGATSPSILAQGGREAGMGQFLVRSKQSEGKYDALTCTTAKLRITQEALILVKHKVESK